MPEAPRGPTARGKKAAPLRITSALRERTRAILETLDQGYPDSHCSLRHRTPFQLLVATILSAQCTDARVNIVTRELFKQAPTPARLAALPLPEIEELVRSTGFFRNKAKNIRAMATMLLDRFGGNVPRTMDELLSLPGVARKTANVVLGTAFGQADGVVVDTHVQRITGILGLTRQRDPKKIEQDLIRLLPKDHWIRFTHQIIDHGRKICIARRPRCDVCPLSSHCPAAGS